jgi:spoIIIJ-associated protein
LSEDVRVETTGETVGEAKWHALRELERVVPGLDRTQVAFEVLSEGERGLLGVGFTPARVVATTGSPVAADDVSEAAADARAVVERVVRQLGVGCHVDVREDDVGILVTCTAGDLGILIGKHGQTIDAVQHLVNAIAFRSPAAKRKPVTVDAAGYRERREATLGALAARSARDAVASGRPVALEAMTPAERKIVHMRLKDFRGVETASEGTEPNRYVVVSPTQGVREPLVPPRAPSSSA